MEQKRRQGGHELWLQVSAEDPAGALAQLPDYVAARCDVVEVSEVRIP